MSKGVSPAGPPASGCGWSESAVSAFPPSPCTESPVRRHRPAEAAADQCPARVDENESEPCQSKGPVKQIDEVMCGETKLTAVPSKAHSTRPDRWEVSARAQKLHWMGKESCWSASSPYFFPGMNTETVLLSRAVKLGRHVILHCGFPPCCRRALGT